MWWYGELKKDELRLFTTYQQVNALKFNKIIKKLAYV